MVIFKKKEAKAIQAIKEKLKSVSDIEKILEKAMAKAQVQKESDLCHYIPIQGKRLHHLALVRMKKNSPGELENLLNQFVLEKNKLKKLPPRQRNKRELEANEEDSKNQKGIKFSFNQIQRLLEIAKKEGEEDLVILLASQQSLPQIQKQLIRSIREKQIDQSLWDIYAKLASDKAAS